MSVSDDLWKFHKLAYCNPGMGGVVQNDGTRGGAAWRELSALIIVPSCPNPPRHLAMPSVGPPSPLSSPTMPNNAVDILPLVLPPLPEIRSEQIRKRIFTHGRSPAKGHKDAFQAPEGHLPADNEE